jgi:hypothetical protein
MALRPPLGIARRRLRRGPSVSIGDLVLTPVMIEECAAGATARGCWLAAAKWPVAVIVAGPGGRHLMRLDEDAESNSGRPFAHNSALGRADRKP